MVGTKEAQTAVGVKNKDIYLQTENGTNILAYNNGRLCPPKCTPQPSPSPDYDNDGLGITIIDRGAKGIVVI
jgi:hypothetical protein